MSSTMTSSSSQGSESAAMNNGGGSPVSGAVVSAAVSPPLTLDSFIGKLGDPGRYQVSRARICKRLWSLGIDSEESTPPGYVVWRAGTTGTTNRVAVPARQAWIDSWAP